MNFPDNTTSKDLWEVCKGYGTVVDVFIPDRKSKEGKRFVFVRFIKVDNVDRLVGNLCTLWIGRMHLHANVARFDLPLIHSSRPNISTRPAANGASSFALVLKGNPNTFNHIASSPAMVLDDECVVERDLDNFVMGEVKDFSLINNLRVLLSNEGFQHVRLAYLGGLWVMIELTSLKELFVWSSMFNDNKEVDDYSEDDSVNGAKEINGDISKQMNLDDETDIEGVSDTVFNDKADSLGHEHTQNLSPNEKGI
ncbi:RNA-directed DNA polymerase, eukaryota, nucleotide-binding alpha-beta plait domain protein [Tanacetum coccineum]